MKQIWGVTKRGEKSYWTNIGVAFENKDGSLNLKFNFIPIDPASTIQVRDKKENNGEAGSNERESAPENNSDDVPF